MLGRPSPLVNMSREDMSTWDRGVGRQRGSRENHRRAGAAVLGFQSRRPRQPGDTVAQRLARAGMGYRDCAASKRAATASQSTTFHHAAR